MEIDKFKLIENLNRIFAVDERCDGKIVRLWSSPDAINMEEILEFLNEKLLDAEYTTKIGANFSDILLLVVTRSFTFDINDVTLHQRRCIALSKLLQYSPDIQRFSKLYFSKVPSPFDAGPLPSPKKKQTRATAPPSITQLDVVECCYRFLKCDVTFYKNAWKWSQFIETYCIDAPTPLYQLICNNIFALLTNMTAMQRNHLNRYIPLDTVVEFEMNSGVDKQKTSTELVAVAEGQEKIEWNYSNDILTNVEGVLLPIFDARNYSFFKTNVDASLVMVNSAKVNLRSVALGVAAGKAVCLSGAVGSGKTILVEYLAGITGRVTPRHVDLVKSDRSHSKENKSQNVNDTKKSATKNKRKRNDANDDDGSTNGPSYDGKSSNGFLRIQLGDQTDSKMLLGQYRCTDVPGEFVWQPGVLTQAVMHGYWLLLEDLDACTQDVCTVLTNLLENNYLSVPGFRDCLPISSGFQLFVTLRTQKGGQTQNSYFQLLDKYLYTINVLPLSRDELCEIICEKYPKLATISNRIVDVFLTFSSGCHGNEADAAIRSNEIDVANGDDAVEMVDTTTVAEAETHLRAARNSGRLVSTRDMLKLCSRSSPTFSVTSVECAYNVFQNAVDLFCSHLTQGPAKTNLIGSIGAKLGIIPSRCDYLSNEYKPEVAVGGTREIKIGRVELLRRLDAAAEGDQMLKRHSQEDDLDGCGIQKRLKLDSSSHLTVHQQLKRKVPHFSFTRLASCILERISVAVQQNEPVLLVGETGVGKTSSVQYLSYQTNHKLVVINMNNQSDVSDLVGGFKPVDLSFVIAPLRAEFEFLFRQTFNANKNEKFLNNVSTCYNAGDHSVLIRLMLKIVETALQRNATIDDTQKSQKSERVQERWSTLKVKLLKLNSQLKNSLNISFAFIAGSLVNCIRNGDWVLLDEINLASSETLECLSTILEPNGSIVLLERGDLVPVKRHPDFRIFACMNPSTDIGKKDLPVGIRNRFTELFVDELVAENDLLILCGDYLKKTGIQQGKVLAIVKLYRKLRALAQLDLNDGLGNRPVYSLRTLCRALTICVRNLCGSVERNMYESFCLSFLTQLDPGSHLLVLDLIQKSLLSNVKAVLKQGIPQPDDTYIKFEGYWIQQGELEQQPCEEYILTESVKENLKDLARIISIGKLPVLLQGPTSAGKTSLIEYVAKRSGNHCLRINNHEHTDLQEYIGTYTADATGKLSFKHGVLVQAMRNGHWIILDELNLAPSDILEALNRVLDDNRELFIPETQELIRAHPNFMLFATQNPPGLYGGRKTLSRAFKNRFIELHFAEIPRAELEIILAKRCQIAESHARRMVKTICGLQGNRKITAKGSFTLRDLFRWGNRYTFANETLKNENTYDWNQHLADEGYLVLSSKIRNEQDAVIIEQTLFDNFRKRIDVDNLFRLHHKTSPVTKDLLEAIAAHPNYQNIVWTFNMRRMAILTGKALEFNDPVLLVGQTGCGKTTICQILADIEAKNLRILNCHMHTEGADFLGGLRPFRGDQTTTDGSGTKVNRQLFEWANGPLVMSMMEGTYFLADEISLAEDSVLERLNCVLEPERTILLAEKGGDSGSAGLHENSEFFIKASNGFQFLATMNPGGDFGKKELSPALRNRFTEIWCRSIDGSEDLIRIAEHSLKVGFNVVHQSNVDQLVTDIATVIVNATLFIKQNVDKFNFSIRDILAWVQFITKNSDLTTKGVLSVHEAIIFGLETIFLDSLEMLPHESYAEIESQRDKITKHVVNDIRAKLQKSLQIDEVNAKRGTTIEDTVTTFGISPFYIGANVQRDQTKSSDFKFTAPTTQNNLFRLLSALSLPKAVLLEGPPGVGKTSLIENLAAAIGYDIVRINLCEHTDLADLFGTDQPSDNSSLELGKSTDTTEASQPTLGAFVWRDGPLLAALKAPNTWILLDELNLAPQSVLEGLNAILDHRGEVYIPELNKNFKLGAQTRIFASQNPLRQGGGRKGLPQSFLNRFTKVYLRKLDAIDLCHVINAKYTPFFEKLKTFLVAADGGDASADGSYFESKGSRFDCCERMVSFSERLDHGINNLEFGYKGGPYEVNLRDILRWCELLSNEKTGFNTNGQEKRSSIDRYNDFMLILFEKMKLVYCQRMRTDIDKAYIRNVFGVTFACDADALEQKSRDISIFWSDRYVYLNDIRLEKHQMDDEVNQQSLVPRTKRSVPLVLRGQRESLKALAECVIMETPVILCGPSDSGKTKLVDIICTLTNEYCNVDTIDDTVTGSFQQIDLNRHLEEIAQNIEAILIQHLQAIVLDEVQAMRSSRNFLQIIRAWEDFVALNSKQNDFTTQTAMSEELTAFKQRLNSLSTVLVALNNITFIDMNRPINLLRSKLTTLSAIVRNAETLNTGGHFEWVDSKIVRALKFGQYICLEHVNLCSSAILDRLNSVFEPNGKLLLSEKGVTSTANEPDQSECVSKHKRFRAFLTLDPKNGEISRAMRNRCVELNFDKDAYSADDLKQLIYENGIGDSYRIDWILRLHNRVQQLTEFHNFNVSHLQKFAFLVAENQRLGCDDRKALYASAMEVYVRSSHIDLLGFGLAYYRGKLIDAICDELNASPSDHINRFDFRNISIRANDLTALALIRLQTEPLVALINCQRDKLSVDQVQNVFASMRCDFGERSFTHIDGKSAKYLLYTLYEVSSRDDLRLRHKYIKSVLERFNETKAETDEVADVQKLTIDLKVMHTVTDFSQNNGEIQRYKLPTATTTTSIEPATQSAPDEGISIRDLLEANDAFASVIEATINADEKNTSLPWNRHIYPRIRDYDNVKDDSKLLKCSGTLLANLSIDKVRASNATKLSQVDAVTYSKAICSKTIPDSLDIDLITHLYPFLTNLKSFAAAVLHDCDTITFEQYVNVGCSVLWADRLLNVSKQRLFAKKTLDDTIIDKLTLHFNWLNKNLLQTLKSLATSPIATEAAKTFEKSRIKLIEYIERNYHPLNQLRKRFVKTLTNFAPFYDERQVQLHTQRQLYEIQTNLMSGMGHFETQDIANRFRLTLSDECHSLRQILYGQSRIDALNWLNDIRPEHLMAVADENLVKLFRQITTEANDSELAVAEIESASEKFMEYVTSLASESSSGDLTAFNLLLTTWPLLEYFALRSLNPLNGGSSQHYALNTEFFLKIQSLGLDELMLVQTVNDNNFKICETIWSHVQQAFINEPMNATALMSSLPVAFYKNYSSFVQSLVAQLRTFAMNSLAVNQDICRIDNSEIVKPSAHAISGPLLSAAALATLFDANGQFRATGLGELEVWRNTLGTVSRVIWQNIETLQNRFGFERTAVTASLAFGRKLLAEIKLMQNTSSATTENAQFLNQFDSLIALLDTQTNRLVPSDSCRYVNFYKSSMITSCVAAIELNLLTFMPLLDPVEKNRLRKIYVEADQRHLTQLVAAFDVMKVMMTYDGLNETICSQFRAKQNDLMQRHEKYSKKCALRPSECMYSRLTKDVNHFLGTCCHPKALLNLFEAIQVSFSKFHDNTDDELERRDVQMATETIKRIDLWVNNAERFEQHVLANYTTYYRDFTAPIHASIVGLKYGLTGLKECLIKERDSTIVKGNVVQRINGDEAISRILVNLVEYPSVDGLRILEEETATDAAVRLNDLLEKIEHKESAYFKLMKSKLQEIQNMLIVCGVIDESNFRKFDATLSVFNQIWKKQEETKRKRAIEEESLYVNKTKCENEDEEAVVNQEIEEMFPNYVDDDFGEFIQNATLEQIIRKPTTNAKTQTDILHDDDLKFICETFIDIMNKYSRAEYHRPKPSDQTVAEQKSNLIDLYRSRSTVFHQMMQKYRTTLNSSVDEAFYNGIGLLIGIAQENHQMIELNADASIRKMYNFYKDPNIPEIHQTTTLLDKIEQRTLVELAQWPDHAVLNDIIRIIAKIRSLPSTSPVVRFSSGFQILRQKVDEWNGVAHSANHMRELEIGIAEYVQRWTRLELQCWRECLSMTYDKVQSKAYRYWFFVYNLLHEYLTSTSTATINACDMTDFKSVEKCFGENETQETEIAGERPKLRTFEVISVLKQYIESSNYGEFGLRMRTLKSFEFYLHYAAIGTAKRRDTLIAVIHNLHSYYAQFSAEIAETIKAHRTPIEKKLKEFVKIESYNKDLSYFSMKNNIARVHRHLHRFLREFETALLGKIAAVFVWRASQTAALAPDEVAPKGKAAAIKQPEFMIDVKNFMASQRFKEKYIDAPTDCPVDSTSLLSRIDKLFGTARNIVKQAILHSQFPGLVYNLSCVLTDQIETCEYLRKLEIDRSQERPKQKMQAKQILTQKRKALSDGFKTLTTLGLSFRAGLLETTLTPELVDLKIPPFCLSTIINNSSRRTVQLSNKNIDDNLISSSENGDLYYARCVFKLKLLQTTMLTPSAELGLPNMERIKGFAVDLFLLVQSQRQTLAKSVKELGQLQESIASVNDLHEASATNDFERLRQRLSWMKRGLHQIEKVFEQYDLLLRCVPNEEDKGLSVVASTNVAAFTKSSSKFKQIRALTTAIGQRAKDLVTQLKECDEKAFLGNESVDALTRTYENILLDIEQVRRVCQLNDDGEQMILVRPLDNLLAAVQLNREPEAVDDDEEDNTAYENIDTELENIVHHVLLSMQNIYKKYSVEKESFYVAPGSLENGGTTENGKVEDEKAEEEGADDDDAGELIQANHLKSKITQEIQSDLVTLNAATILTKLSKIIAAIRHSSINGDASRRLASAKKLISILPILAQYELLFKYYLIQQFGAHKIATKMLSVMLTVFIELGAKGFCIPPDLMQDEDGEKKDKEDGKEGEGFGLEDGTGENDVSDKIENEDQLDTAKKPGDDDKKEDKEDADCKEENGIDMSDDFDSKLQDVEKRGDDSDESEQSDNEEELDKQMGETEEGADKLDDQIWGSDEEPDEEEEDEDDMNDEEDGKGSKEESDAHNNLDANNEPKQGENDEGLDAANQAEKEKKQKEKDIDKIDEQEEGEEQANPYHNELEEPPEPEDMNIGDLNLDNEENNDNDEQRNEENPFDIDTMKENMEVNEDEEQQPPSDDEEQNAENVDKEVSGDSSDEENEEGDGGVKHDEQNVDEQNDEQKDETDKEPETQTRGDDDEPEVDEAADEDKKENERENLKENFQESKDKPSKEENVQAMPDNKPKGSTDQVDIESADKQEQQDELDMQDTGEDKDGVGQAENEESKSGHQGIADTKDTKNTNKRPDQKETQEKRKPGITDEERTISETQNKQRKQLKTIDKTSDERKNDVDEINEEEKSAETDEYQHVKDAKKNDKTTMDTATDEQSKKIHHEDEAQDGEDDKTPEDVDDIDQSMDVDAEQNDELLEPVDDMQSEKNENDNKSKEKGRTGDRNKETCETKEEADVEGDVVDTYNVQRDDETKAFCAMEIVQDSSVAEEMSTADILSMRRMFETERSAGRVIHAQQEDFELWQGVSNKMLPSARELCEQLRLILEPTKCTRLKGDYRTGRRINMKKIIPYIASQFRKDKIWLRRTKPAQRDYKITIAIDDSKSMDHNNSRTMTMQAISLVSQALTLLESGRLSIVSFGEAPQIILNHHEQFDGPKLVKSLSFNQNRTRIAELLDFMRIACGEDGSSSSDNGIFENLLLVLSDGRCIFGEGEKKVRNAIKLARMQRIFIVYIIIDNPENKSSIFDIQEPRYSADGAVTMKPYLDSFPFPYYVIVRDLAQLPLVLSDAMRQWFEMVSSEQ